MSQEHALYEIQTLFPRQKKVNAIDVFILERKTGYHRINFGKKVYNDLRLIKPDNTFFDDRFFQGTEFSCEICRNLNSRYGLIALCVQLYNISQYCIGKEIVRAFIKHVLSYISNYLCYNTTGYVIDKNTLVFPNRDEFYLGVLNHKRIAREMRNKYISKAKKHLKNKNHRWDVRLCEDLTQRKAFVYICEKNGLGAIETTLNEILTLANIVEQKNAMRSIANLIKRFSGTSNKVFYRALNNIF